MNEDMEEEVQTESQAENQTEEVKEEPKSSPELEELKLLRQISQQQQAELERLRTDFTTKQRAPEPESVIPDIEQDPWGHMRVTIENQIKPLRQYVEAEKHKNKFVEEARSLTFKYPALANQVQLFESIWHKMSSQNVEPTRDNVERFVLSEIGSFIINNPQGFPYQTPTSTPTIPNQQQTHVPPNAPRPRPTEVPTPKVELTEAQRRVMKNLGYKVGEEQKFVDQYLSQGTRAFDPFDLKKWD
jgi:hypothetical protein